MKRTSLPYILTSGGRTYYRRGKVLTRLPDPSDPGFLAAYDAAHRRHPAPPTRTTVAALIALYRATSAFNELKPRTQADYDKALAYLGEKAGDRDVAYITTPRIVAMMQANHERGANTFANQLHAVVSVLCKHARLIGWRKDNPATGVPKIRIPKARKQPHVPWTDQVAELWRREAEPLPLLIAEIGIGTMQRPADWTRFRWSDYDGEALKLTQGKTGAELVIPCTPKLKAVLDAAPKRGFTILTTQHGRPLSYSRMSAIMLAERKRLGTAAYDLHALRYYGIMELAWAGCTDEEIASFSGHQSMAMIRLYAGKARQIMRARQANAKRSKRRE